MSPICDLSIVMPAIPENESFLRAAVGAFCVRLNPAVEELADVKTAVSEAVTNVVVHAYGQGEGPVMLQAQVRVDGVLWIEVRDIGCGIADIEQAREPMFTTGNPELRAGMGFAVMESFMDRVEVVSAPGLGTSVRMEKRIKV